MGQIAQKHNKNLQHQVESARDTSGLQEIQMGGHWGQTLGTDTEYDDENSRDSKGHWRLH